LRRWRRIFPTSISPGTITFAAGSAGGLSCRMAATSRMRACSHWVEPTPRVDQEEEMTEVLADLAPPTTTSRESGTRRDSTPSYTSAARATSLAQPSGRALQV